ncbi:MAG: sterol carrier protein domain-containing protein [Chloroflexota bacterium]
MPDTSSRIVGYRRNGRLEGYLAFSFEKAHDANFLLNNMLIRALVYDNPTALSELLAFVRTQADQFDRIIYETQDDRFHFLLSDPRNGSDNLLKGLWHEVNTQGIGIMYRVVDVPALFSALSDHDFGGQTCRIGIALTDTFLPENAGEYVVDFRNGRAKLTETDDDVDVGIRLDVSEFSSLVVGAVGFRKLYQYGLAEISDPAYLETVDRIFHTDQPPLCMFNF